MVGDMSKLLQTHLPLSKPKHSHLRTMGFTLNIWTFAIANERLRNDVQGLGKVIVQYGELVSHAQMCSWVHCVQQRHQFASTGLNWLTAEVAAETPQLRAVASSCYLVFPPANRPPVQLTKGSDLVGFISSAMGSNGPNFPSPRPPLVVRTSPLEDEFVVGSNVLGAGINGKVVECTDRWDVISYFLLLFTWPGWQKCQSDEVDINT